MKHPVLRLRLHRLSGSAGRPHSGAGPATSPISGVKGKLEAVTHGSISIQTQSGVSHVEIKQPLQLIGNSARSESCHIQLICWRRLREAGEWSSRCDSNQDFPGRIARCGRGQCHDGCRSGRHDPQKNDERLCVSTGLRHVPLAYDKRHRAEGQWHDAGCSLPGWRKDDFGACKCPGHSGCAGKGELGSGRHRIRSDNEAAQRNAHDEQGLSHRCSSDRKRDAIAGRFLCLR